MMANTILFMTISFLELRCPVRFGHAFYISRYTKSNSIQSEVVARDLPDLAASAPAASWGSGAPNDSQQ
jgi:hypothetical protein